MQHIVDEAYIKRVTKVQQLVELEPLMIIVDVIFENNFKSIIGKENFDRLQGYFETDTPISGMTSLDQTLVQKIQPAMAYLTYANLIPQLGLSINQFGITTKSSNFDSAADSQRIGLLQKSTSAIANSLLAGFKVWFDEEKESYGVQDIVQKKVNKGGIYTKKRC